MKKHFVTENNIVYWIEEEFDQLNQEVAYVIKKGFYLASYTTKIGTRHIVSGDPITGLVVRHLYDWNMYLTQKNAEVALKELGKKENDKRKSH